MLCSEYRDAFSLFDKKGDNKVELTQVGDIIRALGLNPTEAELKRILQTFPSSEDEGEWIDMELSLISNQEANI